MPEAEPTIRKRKSRGRRPGTREPEPFQYTPEQIEKHRQSLTELALQATKEALRLEQPPGAAKKAPVRLHLLDGHRWLLNRPRKVVFKTPADMRQAVAEYFNWVEDNPLTEYKVTHYQGTIIEMTLPKMRAMSVKAMCLHMRIPKETWDTYRTRKGFQELWLQTRDAIYSQKFEGAAADLLNGNIIARDLGLKEHTDLTSGDEPILRITRTVIQE